MRVRIQGLCALAWLGCAEDSAAAGTLAPLPIRQTSIAGHDHVGSALDVRGDWMATASGVC